MVLVAVQGDACRGAAKGTHTDASARLQGAAAPAA
jgi:hypothetical protein